MQVWFRPAAIEPPLPSEDALNSTVLCRGICGLGDYYGRGDCYRHQGKLDEAMAEYSHALKLDPKFAGACWGRGDCLLAQVSVSTHLCIIREEKTL